MSADEWVIIKARLEGGPQFELQAKRMSRSVQGISRATTTADKATAGATHRTWLWNQALFTMRRLTYGATLAIGSMAAAVVGMGFKFDMMMETARVSFTVLTGSAAKANKEIAFLFDLAAKTPFEFQGVQDAARQFLGWGFSINEVNGYLKTMADVISAMGGSPEIMSRVILAFGQIRSSGRLLGQDLRQLQQAIPGVTGILMRQLKIPREALGAGIGALNIPANVAIDAIMRGIATDPKFKGAAAALQQTMQGQLSTMHDYASRLFGMIVQSPFNAIKGHMNTINNDLAKLTQTMNQQGFGAMIHQLDTMVGGGGRLVNAWTLVRETVKTVADIVKHDLWPAFRDVSQVTGALLYPALLLINNIMQSLAQHSLLLRIIVTALVARYVLLNAVELIQIARKKAIVFWTTRGTLVQRIYAFWTLKNVTAEKLRVLWTDRGARSLKDFLFAMKRNNKGQYAGWVFTGKLATAFRTLYKRIVTIIPAMVTYTAEVWANNAAWYANPIVALIALSVLLVAGLVLLYFKWKRFHNAVDSFFHLLQTNWKYLFWAVPMLGPILQAITYIQTLYNWGRRLYNLFRHPLRIKIDTSAGGIANKLLKLLGFAMPITHIPVVGKYLNPSHYIHLAEGGTITRGGMAVVGEHGRELVNLPPGASVTPLTQKREQFGLVAEVIQPIKLMLKDREIANAVARTRIKVQAAR